MGTSMVGGELVAGEIVAVTEVLTLFAVAEDGGGKRERKSRFLTGLRPARNDTANPTVRNDTAKATVRNDKTGKPSGELNCKTKVTGKRLGEIAEAEFLAKASGMGLAVARPWGDSNRYDFIVDAEGRLWRVQVKSAYRVGRNGGYSFRAHGHSGRSYRASEIDALVAYVAPEDAWYLFPVKVARRMKSLKLFPGSRKKRSKYEKWREAWWVVGFVGRG